MGWQWHQLDHMQVICTPIQTANHASTSSVSFYAPDALELMLLFIDYINKETNATGSVHLSVQLFPLFLLNRLKFDVDLLLTITIARLGLKVKVRLRSVEA